MAQDDVTIKKSTYNQVLAGIVVLAIALSFASGYILGGGGKAPTAAVVQQQQQPQQQAPDQPAAPTRVQVSTDGDPSVGSANAPVTIIEFSDFQCPYCQRWYQQSWASLKADYVDTGKVQFVYRDFPLPFHQNAEIAAEAAECANEQGKYWEMHDVLFTKGSGDGTGLDNVSLMKYASDLKLNTAQFNKCLSDQKYASEIQADETAGSAAGVSGTPSFFIGSPAKGYQLVVGAQPYAVFKQVIDQELAG